MKHMKQIFNSIRMALAHDAAQDEFAHQRPEKVEVRPTLSRWFCGMHDLEETFICRAL